MEFFINKKKKKNSLAPGAPWSLAPWVHWPHWPPHVDGPAFRGDISNTNLNVIRAV